MSIENYPARLTIGFYRVREKWEDAASQVGAYRILANAMAKADEHPGCYVFAEDGTAIYPEPESGLEEEPDRSPVEDTAAEEMPAEGVPVKDTPVEDKSTTDTPSAGADAPPVEELTAAEDVATPDTTPPAEEFPDAVEYENDGGEKVVAYARLKTLMNIRAGNAMDADLISTYRKGAIVEVLQECSNGWLRIKCVESPNGFAYVSNEEQQYAFVGKSMYTVASQDNLWKIAEEQLGDGTRFTEIRQINGLTCNIIRVGMPLILPEK